ncbi:derriere protein [Dendroctonus ponderosae]|uniref:derriere protein n=1 Tax=Dendroctonus ponderosae TaxID=77166 RepID=UPI00203634E7|nr:derriere protein [Dendroctonus ponderosae]
MNRKFSWVFLPIFQFLTIESLNNSGKSYYFKGIGNNEFSVHNRIHFLNHNITDLDANPHPPQNIQNVRKDTKESPKKIQLKQFFLDDEWNYVPKQTNKTNIPVFIKKFYEQRLKEPNNTDTVRILFNLHRNSSNTIIKFDLSSLKIENENVTDAEMYFYWPLENTSSIYKTSVVLRLYQFESQFSNDLNESILVENPDVHKLFNVIYISKAQKGWQTFKIKKPIENWISGEDNLGLLLTISSYDDNKLISIFNDTNEGVFKTFAVLNIRRNQTLSPSTTNHRAANQTAPVKSNTACSKKPWKLDFQQLQWDSFILYPENGFMAYQCSGRCHLEDNRKQNNHAKLKQFVNGVREKVCCVPNEYSSLPIMYLDRSGNVVLKSYDQVVVESCGCR